jgi:mannose-6-phosphate isomerase-like protein (cupin superfamily)
MEQDIMSLPSPNTVRVIDSAVDCPELPLVIGEGTAKAVIWPGIGAGHRTLQVIELLHHAKTIDLRHDSDSAYYVAKGLGIIVDVKTGEQSALTEGSMIHIDRGDTYRFEATASAGMKILGGPCPADSSLYAQLNVAGSR